MMTAPRYDVERMFRDIVGKGWQANELARRAKVSPSTVTRFLSGEFQTPKMAKRLSKALGHGPAHYLIDQEAVA